LLKYEFNLTLYFLEDGNGDTKIDINGLEKFSSPVHIIDTATFSDGATFIMNKICGATVKIQGNALFTHCFEDDETEIFLELDFSINKVLSIKSPGELVIIWSDM
jgi:hypothetical protein